MREKDIEKIKENTYYDFSDFDFTLRYDAKSIVHCPKHGKLYRTFRNLKRGSICVECDNEKRVNPCRETNETFTKKLLEKYPTHSLVLDNFDYPKNQHTLVELQCKIHGNVSTTPNRAMYMKKDPCPECNSEKLNKSRTGDLDKFIEKAKEKYGDKYSYPTTSFSRLSDTVEVFCNIHSKLFSINANNFLYSAKVGCPDCIRDKIRDTQRLSQEEFIRRVNKVSPNKYNLSEALYEKSDSPVKVTCKKCSLIFYPLADNLMNGSGCPFCKNINRVNNQKNNKTIIYIVKVRDLYKIGVTGKSIKKRYQRELKEDYDILYQREFPEGRIPFTIEQRTRSALWEYNYKGKSLFANTGNTEVFTINPTETLLRIQEEVIKEKHNINT